jgi:hypothetical protein
VVLYIHYLISLHVVVLNLLSTETTLPLPGTTLLLLVPVCYIYSNLTRFHFHSFQSVSVGCFVAFNRLIYFISSLLPTTVGLS